MLHWPSGEEFIILLLASFSCWEHTLLIYCHDHILHIFRQKISICFIGNMLKMYIAKSYLILFTQTREPKENHG